MLLRKYWFSVSQDEQERRMRARLDDPMRRWKLSPAANPASYVPDHAGTL